MPALLLLASIGTRGVPLDSITADGARVKCGQRRNGKGEGREREGKHGRMAIAK